MLTEEALISENQDEINRLETFLNIGQGFRLGFVEVNLWSQGDALIDYLHENHEDIQFAVLELKDEQLRYVFDELRKWIIEIELELNKKLVLIIRGLEKGVRGSEEYPPALINLNFVRDALPRFFPHPILFLLPTYALTKLIQSAPDLWAWRSGLFPLHMFNKTTSRSDRELTELAAWKERKRIEASEDLLAQYITQGNDNHQTQVQLLNELGYRHLYLKNFEKASSFLKNALATSNPENLSERATTLRYLGNLAEEQGDWAGALELYIQSESICLEIGNRFSLAKLLDDMGILYLNQGRWEEAASCHEQSLQIHTLTGGRKNRSITLNNLGIAYLNQGRWEEAASCYEEFLSLFGKFGDHKVKEKTLKNLGFVYNNLGVVYENRANWEKAIFCYQQGQKTCQELGDSHGEGQTLLNLGNIYIAQGNEKCGAACWQEALSKLNPDSPEHQQLLTYLSQENRPPIPRATGA